MKKPLRRYYLNPEEYAKIISEINANFDNYMIYFRKDMSEVII